MPKDFSKEASMYRSTFLGGMPERIEKKLGNKGSGSVPSDSVTTNPTRTISRVYYSAAQQRNKERGDWDR